MKFIIALSAFLVCGLSSFAGPLKLKTTENRFAKGRIIVEGKAGLSATALSKILSKHGGKGRKIRQSKLNIVDLPADASEVDVVAQLLKDPNIKLAQLDRLVESTFTPNDTYYTSQWFLPKTGVNTAWDFTMGSGVTIAILDSGVDSTHPDLIPNLVPGYNIYDDNTNTTDVCGHGTAVAGVAGAAGNNALGVAGVANKSKIMPIRIAFYDSSIGSCYAYESTIADGIMYAADHGVRVVNVSYGPLAGSSVIQSAGDYLKNKGGLLFLSAGNNGIDEDLIPTTSLIAVAATDNSDLKASWSSYGTFVSLSAPGTSIVTTTNGGSYGSWNGTSFATPLVSGVAALVMAARPNLSSAEVENILFSTAVDLGPAGRDSSFGFGRVNADAAVRAALASGPAPDTQAPTVSITSPSPGATVSGFVTVNVSATDNVAVTHVDLVVNGTVVGTTSSFPYSFSWDSKSVANGAANLIAAAFDAAGNSKSTTALSVTVSNALPDTQAPTTSTITSPAANTTVSGTVTVNASASDNVGVHHVDLKVNGIKVATDSVAPFSFSWDSKTVANGTASLVAVAFDAAGNSKSSTAVSVTVSNALPDTQPPATSSITSPAANATVSGTVTVNASASDNVGVHHVDLKVNGSVVATDSAAPFSFSWNSKTVANGATSLVAVAYDAAGNSKSSTAISVNVANVIPDTQAPTSSITSPTNFATVAGLATINVSATDNIGVHHVDLLVNGSKVATDTTSPYSFSWDTRTVANGAKNLVAVAFDAAGNSTSSTAVSVNVINIDTTAPTSSITAPTANATVIGTVTISVAAADTFGVDHVDLKVNGTVVATDTSSPFNFSWDSKSVANGTVSLVAVAYDAAGNSTASTAVSIKVANPLPDTTAPTSAISSPTNNATVVGLVTVNVSATDAAGVHHVDLLVNGSKVATDTVAPFSFSWDSKTVANGNATLVAIAYDAAGNSKSSTTITVKVNNPIPDTTAPVVVINSPTAGAVSANVNISISATDNSGTAGLTLTIEVDGVIKKQGTGGSMQYGWSTTAVAAGIHIIKATATDKAGNKSSASVQMTK